MDYIIRNCNQQDLSALVELCRKHAEYEKASYDSKNKQGLLQEALFSVPPKLYCLIVECQSKAVGYASYTIDFSTWDGADFLHMDCLYLEPQFRGYGIGKVIINKLKDIAMHRACVNIQWQTPDFNEKAIGFYKKIGAVGKGKIRFSLSTDCK